MKKLARILLGLGVVSAAASGAFADPSNINPAKRFCWGENIGYLNWRDAGSPQGSQGAVVDAHTLSGFVWGENIGWINLGDGTPASGNHYGNTDGDDCGVNIDASDDLFGFAWGENIGWVNFDTRAALGPSGQQARVDRAAKRLRGYAWGENVGWIILDDSSKYVSFACPADFDANGISSIDDLFIYINAYFNNCSGQADAPCNGLNADFNGSGGLTIDDLFLYLNAWFSGC